MSWFNLGIEGKKYFDQHRSFTSIVTGNYVSKVLYKNFIKDCPLNIQLREIAKKQLSPLVVSHFMPSCAETVDGIIKVSVKKEKFHYLSSRLKHHFIRDPKRHLLFIARQSATLIGYAGRKIVKLVKHQDTANLPNSVVPAIENVRVRKTVKSHLRKGEVSEVVHQMVLKKLRPICQEAVEKTINSMAEKGIAKAYDFSMNKTLSIVVLPFVYSLALAVSGAVCSSSLPCAGFNDYLPHPGTLLALSAAGNAMQMGCVLWNKITRESDCIDADKERVKELAIKLTRESVSQKIKENKFLSAIQANNTSEGVDALASLLVSEMVDFYWNDLHEKKIFGVPLVS